MKRAVEGDGGGGKVSLCHQQKQWSIFFIASSMDHPFIASVGGKGNLLCPPPTVQCASVPPQWRSIADCRIEGIAELQGWAAGSMITEVYDCGVEDGQWGAQCLWPSDRQRSTAPLPVWGQNGNVGPPQHAHTDTVRHFDPDCQQYFARFARQCSQTKQRFPRNTCNQGHS